MTTTSETGTPRYRKKPVVIEARQYQDGPGGGNRQELAQWCGGDWTARFRPTGNPEVDDAVLVITIRTLEGVMEADPGDWIIKGVAGEFYPCKPDIFAETYEPADGDQVTVSREDLGIVLRQCATVPALPHEADAWIRLSAAAGDPQ